MDIVVASIANSVGSEAVGDSGDASRMTLRDNGLFARSLHQRIASDADSMAHAVSNHGTDTLAKIGTGVPPQVLDDSGTAALPGVSPGNVRNLKEPAIIASGSRGEEIFQKTPATPTNVAGTSGSQDVGANLVVSVGPQGRTQASYPKNVQVGTPSGNGEETAGEEVQGQQSLLQTVRAPAATTAAMDGGVVVDASQKKISGEAKLEAVGSTKVISKESDHEAKRLATLKDTKSVEGKSVVVSKPADAIVPLAVSPLVVSVAVPAAVHGLTLPALVGGKQNEGGGSARRSSGKAMAPTQKYVTSPVSVRSEAGAHSGAMAPVDAAPVVVSAREGVEPDSAKAGAPAVSGKSDSDGKLLNEGALASSSHSGPAMAGGATSLAVGLTPPTHTAGIVVLSKAQSGDGGVLTGATQTGVPEHDVSGAMVLPALDGGHRTLVATPTALEVGISNGSQGWLKIRAEIGGGGGVNASLSATVPSGQEMLHRELPSLTAYLQQERVAVNSVVIHTSAGLGTSPGGGGGGMGNGNGSQTQQRGDEGSANRSLGNSPPPNYIEEIGSSSLNTVDANDALSSPQFAVGGSWLSVRA